MITKAMLDAAPDKTAWKTATMRGYLFKTKLDAETYGVKAYSLTFRQAADVGGNPVDYVFYFNCTESTPPADAQNLNLGTELLGHVLDAAWQSGKQTDFEEVRSGGGTW